MEDKTAERFRELAAKLWIDYLDLAESYQNDLEPPQLGALLISYVMQMLCDTAPNIGAAYRVALTGMDNGYCRHLEEKGKTND